MLYLKKHPQKYNDDCRKKVELQVIGEPIRSMMPGCLLLIMIPVVATVTGYMVYQILA